MEGGSDILTAGNYIPFYMFLGMTFKAVASEFMRTKIRSNPLGEGDDILGESEKATKW